MTILVKYEKMTDTAENNTTSLIRHTSLLRHGSRSLREEMWKLSVVHGTFLRKMHWFR